MWIVRQAFRPAALSQRNVRAGAGDTRPIRRGQGHGEGGTDLRTPRWLCSHAGWAQVASALYAS